MAEPRPPRTTSRSGLAATLVVALVVALFAGVLSSLVLPAGPASASPSLASAKARAAALRQSVDALTVQAETASEHYNAVQSELDAVVTRRLLASRQVSQATQAVTAHRSDASARVRAFYMAGGPLALYSTVLSGSDPSEVLDRYQAVTAIVSDDHRAVADGQAVVADARAISARATRLALRQRSLEKQAAHAAVAVRALLAEQKRLLTSADADVVRLAEIQRKAAERQAAHEAAVALAAAQAAAEAAARAAIEQAAQQAAQLAAKAAAGPTAPAGPGAGASGPGSADRSAAVPFSLAPSAPVGTASAKALRAISAARTVLGAPYVWGATGPRSFDCSGLTGWAYRAAGISLPRTSRQQWFAGPHVRLGDLQPGDLLFWASNTSDPGTIHHVALYIGGGRIIQAPHTGDVVRVSALWLTGYIGAVRPSG
jgi:peptidoglycan DL-endopeptidase CwlO